jgi:hypothetical protein
MSSTEVISLPKNTGLTQGIIFTGAIAEQYRGCAVYGVIITARCDIAHDKAHVYNYLPIVSFSDWMERDFVDLVLPALKKNINSNISSLLKNMKFSPSIMMSAAPSEVYERLVKETASKKAKESFEKNLQFLQDVDDVEKSFTKEKLVKLVNDFPSLRDDFINRLLNHNLNGYYFLESIDVGDINEGFVVLLREIGSIPRYLASKLQDGFAVDELGLIIQSNAACQDKICFEGIEYAMPISQLLSPNIEHLMQSFGSTFCRIGVKDIDSKYPDYMRNLHFGISQ